MRYLSQIKHSELKSIRGVCFDIDDTFSTQGKITSEAYQALWDLKNAGYTLVPITGRPAGWCDHIARFWPVDAVVGENGAFSMYMKSKKLSKMDTISPAQNKMNLKKLDQLKTKIKQEFKGVSFASDQAYREFDLAIDIKEDVKPWSQVSIQDLILFCEGVGAHAKLSSIHVNTWYGEYDKWSGFKVFLRKGPLNSNLRNPDVWVFVGDSPNDEPLFRVFKHSVGVSNLKPYLKTLKYPPTFITQEPMGLGFRELALKLLASRTKAHSGKVN